MHHRHAGNVNLMSKAFCIHIVWTWPFWIWMNPITSRQLSVIFQPVLCHSAMSQIFLTCMPSVVMLVQSFRGLCHEGSVKISSHTLSVGLTQHLCHPPLIYKCISTSCPAQKCNCRLCRLIWYWLCNAITNKTRSDGAFEKEGAENWLQPLVHCFPPAKLF